MRLATSECLFQECSLISDHAEVKNDPNNEIEENAIIEEKLKREFESYLKVENEEIVDQEEREPKEEDVDVTEEEIVDQEEKEPKEEDVVVTEEEMEDLTNAASRATSYKIRMNPVVILKKLLPEQIKATRTVKCFECCLLFSDEISLDTHVLLVHKNFDQFQCSECGKKFDIKVALSKHILSTHCKSRSIHKCIECGSVFNNVTNLNAHAFICHLQGNVTTVRSTNLFSQNSKKASHPKKLKENSCPECDCTFNQKIRKLQHIETVHKMSKGRPFDCSTPDESPQRKLTLFKCHECHFVFNQRVDLFTHLLSDHRDTREFRCSKCSYSVNDKIYLDNHIKSVHSEGVNGNNFNVNDLNSLTPTQRKVIAFSFTQCNRSFKQKNHFEKHLSCHKKDKSVQTSETDCILNENSKLLQNLQSSHKKFKLFICSNCDFAFKRKRQLQEHVALVHTCSIKSFKCSICESAFAEFGQLTKHIFTLHKN